MHHQASFGITGLKLISISVQQVRVARPRSRFLASAVSAMIPWKMALVQTVDMPSAASVCRSTWPVWRALSPAQPASAPFALIFGLPQPAVRTFGLYMCLISLLCTFSLFDCARRHVAADCSYTDVALHKPPLHMQVTMSQLVRQGRRTWLHQHLKQAAL